MDNEPTTTQRAGRIEAGRIGAGRLEAGRGGAEPGGAEPGGAGRGGAEPADGELVDTELVDTELVDGELVEEWPPRYWRESTRGGMGRRGALYVTAGMVGVILVLVIISIWASHNG